MAIKLFVGKQPLSGVDIGPVTQHFQVTPTQDSSGKRLVRSGATQDYQTMLSESLPAKQLLSLIDNVSEDGFQLVVVHDKPIAVDGQPPKLTDFYQENLLHAVVSQATTDHLSGRLSVVIRFTQIERKSLV